MNQFSQEELKNLSILLQRVDLKGSEALPVVELQLKIKKLIVPETTSETTGTENA